MIPCQVPDCGGTILDGYCDRCGIAASSIPAGGPVTPASPPGTVPGATGTEAATSASARLGSTPLGSRRTAPGTRPTRRVGATTSPRSRLGAGYTSVPTAPVLDPVAALMEPPEVPERKRHCSGCGAPVGRSRGDQPGRTTGFCPKCRTPFDFDPKLRPGTLLGGQYEVVGCLAHGGMGWIYLARDRNVNDRWVVLKGLLNAGDPDAFRAAVTEKQFLAEVEHPLIVEIYNFETHTDGTSYIVMEFVGGKSLSDLLKARMAARGGTFDPLPPDQAIAFIIEVLPAFAYLHAAGLLYCDFKPANLIQVADSIKLIDLGGVRRVDDDTSPIYGTVGYQAPEVPSDGCSVASDLFTVARTLAVLVFEFAGYQDRYLSTMAPQDASPVLERHDSLYRWLVKGMAERPEDRFQSADEMRDQLVGVLREVVAINDPSGASARGSTPSALFEAPGSTVERPGWSDLPSLRPDPADPMASWITGVTVTDPDRRIDVLRTAPQMTAAVRQALAEAGLAGGHSAVVHEAGDALLADDPWSWRAVWLSGMLALSEQRAADAVAAFNTVYGEIPGELAPKLALAVACEAAGETEVAHRLYTVCASADAAYASAARFGLARLARAVGDVEAALAALDGIPGSSRSWPAARAERARLLVARVAAGHGGLEDLALAHDANAAAGGDPYRSAVTAAEILGAALARVGADGPRVDVRLGGVAATERDLRTALETTWREAARHSPDAGERVRCVDTANRVRPRTWV